MNLAVVRRIAEATIFFVLLVTAVFVVSRVVERKQSRDLFAGFLEEPEAYDVLFFGDSQFMNGMLPMEMWEDYGIAGYNLSCYGNVMPTTYWSIINALDYATPKLVVLSINGLNEVHKVSNYSGDLHTAIDFWPLTPNKVRMIEDLLYDPEDPDFSDVSGYVYRELKPEFYFKLGKYHSRWSELTWNDFKTRPDYVKGGELLVGLMPIMDYELVNENAFAEEGGYSYSYLRAAIEECCKRGIEVLLVHMPAPQYIDSQKHANTVRSIAEEYEIGFVDTTYMDSIVDYAVDCCDAEPHLNVSGALKMTAFLSSYIHDHYELPDRRDEVSYLHWNKQLDDYKDMKMELICDQEELDYVLMLLHDRDFDVRIAIGPKAIRNFDEQRIILMHNIVRERVLSGEEFEKWSNFMYPLREFETAVYDESAYFLHKQEGGFVEWIGEAAHMQALETFERFEEGDIMIEIIDRRHGKPVKQLCF